MQRTKTVRATALSIVTLLAAVTFLATGCAEDTSTTTSPTPSTVGATTSTLAAPTTTAATAAPSTVTSTVPSLPPSSGLTLEQVRNADLSLPFGDGDLTFTLVDGYYRSEGTGDDPSGVEVTMSDAVAFGDLDGDGVDDAAIALRALEGTDGSSEYVVAMLAQGGKPVQGGYHLLGVGARIDALSIADAKIALEAAVPGPEEPAGDPTVPITATLQFPLLEGSSRVLLHTSQTSETPAGDIREITITSPEPGAWVFDPCMITGTVTIAPFENNLVYKVYDTEMIERGTGPLMVDAPDFGAPGTFELVIDLASLGCTGGFFVTISDLSAADGSILAMASIDLRIASPG